MYICEIYNYETSRKANIIRHKESRIHRKKEIVQKTEKVNKGTPNKYHKYPNTPLKSDSISKSAHNVTIKCAH